MQIAILGLGKMGSSIVEKLLVGGHEVVVWNRTTEVLEKLRVEKAEAIVSQKLAIVHSIAELRGVLRKPRVIWSMVPAGEATETVLTEVHNVVEGGDMVIDGGNAKYTDTEKHYTDFQAKSVKFLGIGVSGGVHGFERGFSLMVGGTKETYEYITPILDTLVKPNGVHAYFGTGGAGHFVKMVHNGIEYGMMQAIGEGFGVLAKSKYQFNLPQIASVYQHGSVVSSFLIDMVANALKADPTLVHTEGIIAENGEARWTIEQAKEEKVPIDVIEKSLDFRVRSQTDPLVQNTFAAKLVQAMRHEFGGHVVKKTEPPKPTQ